MLQCLLHVLFLLFLLLLLLILFLILLFIFLFLFCTTLWQGLLTLPPRRPEVSSPDSVGRPAVGQTAGSGDPRRTVADGGVRRPAPNSRRRRGQETRAEQSASRQVEIGKLVPSRSYVCSADKSLELLSTRI